MVLLCFLPVIDVRKSPVALLFSTWKPNSYWIWWRGGYPHHMIDRYDRRFSAMFDRRTQSCREGSVTARKSPLLWLGLSVIKRKREVEQALCSLPSCFCPGWLFSLAVKGKGGVRPWAKHPLWWSWKGGASRFKRNRKRRWNIVRFRNAVGGFPLINGQCLRKRGGRGWFPPLALCQRGDNGALSRSQFSSIRLTLPPHVFTEMFTLGKWALWLSLAWSLNVEWVCTHTHTRFIDFTAGTGYILD